MKNLPECFQNDHEILAAIALLEAVGLRVSVGGKEKKKPVTPANCDHMIATRFKIGK